MEKYHRDNTYIVLNKNESIAYVQRTLKYRANKSKHQKEKTRIARAAESTATAKIMREQSEEYKARVGGGGNITAEDLLMPPIEVEIRKDKKDLPVVYYKTPTIDDPYKVNDTFPRGGSWSSHQSWWPLCPTARRPYTMLK